MPAASRPGRRPLPAVTRPVPTPEVASARDGLKFAQEEDIRHVTAPVPAYNAEAIDLLEALGRPDAARSRGRPHGASRRAPARESLRRLVDGLRFEEFTKDRCGLSAMAARAGPFPLDDRRAGPRPGFAEPNYLTQLRHTEPPLARWERLGAGQRGCRFSPKGGATGGD